MHQRKTKKKIKQNKTRKCNVIQKPNEKHRENYTLNEWTTRTPPKLWSWLRCDIREASSEFWKHKSDCLFLAHGRYDKEDIQFMYMYCVEITIYNSVEITTTYYYFNIFNKGCRNNYIFFQVSLTGFHIQVCVNCLDTVRWRSLKLIGLHSTFQIRVKLYACRTNFGTIVNKSIRNL